MKHTLGLKLSHDGTVAGAAGSKLLFSIEAEKIRNGERYSKLSNVEMIEEVTKSFQFTPDVTVVDGWKDGVVSNFRNLPVACYHDFDSHGDMFDMMRGVGYLSFKHMAGHILGGYATAPFSSSLESAYVLTFDGGQNPRVHYLMPRRRKIEYVGSIFTMYGILYGIMGRYFGPYKIDHIELAQREQIGDKIWFGGYHVPGKIMSYMGAGTIDETFLVEVDKFLGDIEARCERNLGFNEDGVLEHQLMRRITTVAKSFDLTDADILLCIHTVLSNRIVNWLTSNIPAGSNLVFVGGSALNIKWNSAIRSTGHFKSVWVPPFPNDTGSAIGQICAYNAVADDCWSLDWNVYNGPMIHTGEIQGGWKKEPFDVNQMAQFFADNPNNPVVVLNGRAECGPRALGNRSIFVSATHSVNRDLLNKVKQREAFRPVAPICLEQYAPAIFCPGSPDPYMLFDHRVRLDWKDKIPAIVHLDGTARLQTVNEAQNKLIFDLLTRYKDLTGIPLLCNTSANFNGCGFFPDVESAMKWGAVSHIWSNNNLYTKESKG